MNNWLYKLEQKFGDYAILDLTRYVIICYVIGYALQYMGFIDYVSLDPYLIMRGQVWRIFTWVLMPPTALGIFTLIMLMFYYWIGTSLESTWGPFRYNVYMLGGFLFTLVGAFITYGLGIANNISPVQLGYYISGLVSTYYINMSLLLAFAASYPDIQIRIYFLFPLKIKWLAIFDLACIIIDFVNYNWIGRSVILASLLNFVLFYFSTKNMMHLDSKQSKRRKEFRKAVNKAKREGWNPVNGGVGETNFSQMGIAKHKCAICGRTELTDPDMEFRFCSKCNGNYEYCEEHLYTHQHVQ